MKGFVAATAFLGTATATAPAAAVEETGVLVLQDASGVPHVSRTRVLRGEGGIPVLQNSDGKPYAWDSSKKTALPVFQDANGVPYAPSAKAVRDVQSGMPVFQHSNGVPYVPSPQVSLDAQSAVPVLQDADGVLYVSHTKATDTESGVPVPEGQDGVPFVWRPAQQTRRPVFQDADGVPYAPTSTASNLAWIPSTAARNAQEIGTIVQQDTNGVPIVPNSSGVTFVHVSDPFPFTKTSFYFPSTIGGLAPQSQNGVTFVSSPATAASSSTQETGVRVQQAPNGVPYAPSPAPSLTTSTVSERPFHTAHGPVVVSYPTASTTATDIFSAIIPILSSIINNAIDNPSVSATTTALNSEATPSAARDSWPVPIEFCSDHGTVCGPTPLPEPTICIGCGKRSITVMPGEGFEDRAVPTTFVTAVVGRGVELGRTMAADAEAAVGGSGRICGERFEC